MMIAGRASLKVSRFLIVIFWSSSIILHHSTIRATTSDLGYVPKLNTLCPLYFNKSRKMKHEIHTAVLHHEQCGDIEEPLLKATDDQDATIARETKELSRYFRLVGCLFGLWFQMISLGATALLAKWFGEETVLQTFEDKVLFYALFGLLLFPIICRVVERSWTNDGNQYLHKHFLHQLSCKQLPKRYTFLIGAQFLMGIVLGSFATWGCVDLFIGTSTSMFLTLIASMMACTALCYTFILVYDDSVDGDEDDDM
jgi:hypothetical protein